MMKRCTRLWMLVVCLSLLALGFEVACFWCFIYGPYTDRTLTIALSFHVAAICCSGGIGWTLGCLDYCKEPSE